MTEITFKEEVTFDSEAKRRRYLQKIERLRVFMKMGGMVRMTYLSGKTFACDESLLANERRWAENYIVSKRG